MTKPRVTTADRFSNVIEVVELGRRSGLLTVERGSQQAIEQGEVYFSQGRAIYAAVEGLRGPEALSALAGWGTCRFAFEPNAPRPQPNIIAPMSSPTMGGSAGSSGMGGMGGAGYPPPQRAQPTPPRSGPATFNWDIPANPGAPNQAPNQSRGMPAGGPSQGSAAPSAPSTPSSTFGASWPGDWANTPPAGSRMPTGQLSWPSQATGPFTSGSLTNSHLRPGELERRPRRSPDVRDLMAVVSAHNLSRNHRTILLLADGEHTVLDIARLSSKPVDEIVALLADLERAGLVY